jgi:hypothetical protein
LLKKSAKTLLKCGRFQSNPKITTHIYSLHGSLVEHPLSARGGACLIPAEVIIFKLGLSLSQDENAAGSEFVQMATMASYKYKYKYKYK